MAKDSMHTYQSTVTATDWRHADGDTWGKGEVTFANHGTYPINDGLPTAQPWEELDIIPPSRVDNNECR